MSNFKSASKRKRELAKLDKRKAKERKRALRKADRSRANDGTTVAISGTVAQRAPADHDQRGPGMGIARAPITLAEAVERWKKTKVGEPKKR